MFPNSSSLSVSSHQCQTKDHSSRCVGRILMQLQLLDHQGNFVPEWRFVGNSLKAIPRLFELVHSFPCRG
jgi:hypothetical protein